VYNLVSEHNEGTVRIICTVNSPNMGTLLIRPISQLAWFVLPSGFSQNLFIKELSEAL
jgi:hypothetical protein